MKLIKPHNEQFGIKYEMTFDGISHRITYAWKVRGNGGHYSFPSTFAFGPKWWLVFRLAVIRYFQWRDLARDAAIKAKSIYPHKVLPY